MLCVVWPNNNNISQNPFADSKDGPRIFTKPDKNEVFAKHRLYMRAYLYHIHLFISYSFYIRYTIKLNV